MKKYEFNGEIYTDLEALCQAFVANFDAAVEQIFNKPRKLVSFVKSFDKEKAKKVTEIFETTKYKGNVVSFILFNLMKNPIVLVNGVNLDFNNFIKVIGINRENKAIKAFMEDNGMTKTYATMDIDKKIPNDSFYIEKTFDDDFTFKYISNYLRVDYTENLNGFISNILINDDERFRRACEVVKSDAFQMVIAHKANFKAAYNIRYSNNPIFEAIKMLAIEYSKEDLTKIIDNTFYWWLLDNYDKYSYHKKEATALKSSLNKLKKESQKNLTFDEHVELCKRLYEVYLLFADAYSKGDITVNTKKYDEDQYALDKHYCRTLICIDFMKTHPVKLSTQEEIKAEEALKAKNKEADQIIDNIKEEVAPEEEANEQKLEDGKEIEVIKDDAPTEKELNFAEKRTKKLRGMIKFISFSAFIVGLILALIYFLFPILPEKISTLDIKTYLDSFEQNKDMLTLLTYAGLATAGFVLILNIVISVRNNQSSKAINLYYKHESIGKKDSNLSIDDQKSINYFEEHEDKIYARIKRRERIITAISLGAAGVVYSLLIYIPVLIYKVELNAAMGYVSLGASFGAGLLWGLLFKKKGAFSAFFIMLVSIGLTVALLLFV